MRSRAGELQSRELSQGEGVLLSMRQGALLSPLPGTMLRILTKGGQGVTVEQGPVSTRVYPTGLCYGSQSQVRKGRNFNLVNMKGANFVGVFGAYVKTLL